MKSSVSGRNLGNVKANERSARECRERFFKLWDEYGYGDKFEFLGGCTSSKGKAKIRCRICGCEFERFGGFVQQHTNIRCANCWIHLNDDTDAPRDYMLAEHVSEAYINGSTVASIADTYNLDERVVSKLIREQGVAINCNRYNKSHRYNKSQPDKSKQIKRSIDAIQREVDAWRRAYDRRCKILGEETAKIDNLFGKLNDWASGECPYSASTIASYEPQEAVCKHCGKHWIFWPSHKRYGRKKPALYCSHYCKVKHNKQPSNIGHRLRKYGSVSKQRDVIHLRDLYERDRGICQICGKITDWNDYERNIDGSFFYIGGTYPTCDHIIPLAKGGTHTWGNVQLAHRDCNSSKGASYIGVAQ